MKKEIITSHPHRRYNPLNGDWILVSPQRTKRPWQGKIEKSTVDEQPGYDPNCYLCPGNERAGSKRNPQYENTFAFENDFPALLPAGSSILFESDSLMQLESVQGVCRVICFSPRHDLTLSRMSTSDIRKVIDLWADQVNELGKKFRWVQIFENKGEIMGCSNPHPHGQIWASNSLPNEPFKENHKQKTYMRKHESVLLCDYLQRELTLGDRLIMENEHWAVLVPFWATWPFESLLLPKRHILKLPELSDTERDSLADILRRYLIRCDNLFETSFPYTMGWHGAPTDSNDFTYWQLHCHFYPPLLRSATIKKFMVGYEMLAEAQRDMTPEQSAIKLRGLSEIHYKER